MTNAAVLKNVSFRYANGDAGALKHLNLTVKQGECVLLCGSSGCGKTTVTRLLNGLIPHYYEGTLEGEVSVFGKSIRETAIEDLAGIVGSVFQNPRSQFFCVDTTAEIAFGCENTGLPEAEIRRRIDSTVTDMKIQELQGRSIFNLSGGEKQKIACAGVAAMLPELIVLDEPTSNLDLDAIDELRECIQKWKTQGKTIVIAEHRLGWLSGLCDSVLFMENGSISAEFAGDAFFSLQTAQLNSMGLRAVKPANHYLESRTGMTEIKPVSDHGLIMLENFRYKYGKQTALDIGSLALPKGAVIAVVGHNGAGKTTFTKCLCGLQKHFKGIVRTEGKTYRPKDMMRMAYMVMQDVNHQLFAETVLEEVMLGADDAAEQNVLDILEKLHIANYKDRHPMSLSGGQKQRVAIASALLAGKKLLVFDEPTSGLDFRSMECTAELLRSLDPDITVLIVTHDMELIDRCCTHILHIESGQPESGYNRKRKRNETDKNDVG
ncbi:MAG: ABC transporter ATP-binding protein [Oscillospiraceae bacterium]|nr:ABC transporter ATP-binding protein [Oscillospiraceae bacterium]